MKKITALAVVFTFLLILTGCSQASRIEKGEVVYKFKGKEYTTRTSDFKVKKSTKTYAKIAKEDIGKPKSSLVIYIK